MSLATRPVTHIAMLLALLLVAFALRVYALDAQSLWYDEAVTAQVAQQGLGELAQWTADDIQPPLYYAMVAGWTRLMGTSEWALRFPSVAFGLLMVALAYALGRRLFGQPSAWLAALLAGIHPLWVYYSQEARMYTLLTALGMLAGYALLRVLAAAKKANAGRERLAWWTVVVVASIALLYTHYFAAFLLLAFGLFFVLALATDTPRTEVDGKPSRLRLFGEGALVALLVAVAYLPWLPNALRRFRVDTSYWQGALKLDEAIRHVAISFTTGETVLEQQAIPLAWGMAALAGACLVALVWTAIRGDRPSAIGDRSSVIGQSSTIDTNPPTASLPRATLFITLYLLVPVVAILFLSYRTPKFNPRYLMLASPALVLLLAGGLALPFGRATSASRRASQVARIVSTIALVAVTGIFLLADRNWFADPAFTKDDWRGAVAYVRSHLAPDEAVVLVSGHTLPAWRYYAPDVEPVRLPELETLDVSAVLDLDGAASALDARMGGKQGAWLVRWQNGVVDPTGVVPYLLESAGTQQPIEASFWGLDSPQHYRWQAGTSFQPLAEPPLDAALQGQQLPINFDNQVELVGYSQPPCDQADCPVYLFWRALAPLHADYKLNATLLGRDFDDAWSEPTDRRLAAYDYPTFRWPQGKIVLSQVPLNASIGTPPGEYRLRLSVYDDVTGDALNVLDTANAPQGRWAWLDPVEVNQVVVDGPGEVPPAGNDIRLAPGLLLRDFRLKTTEVEPGERIPAQAWWVLDQRPTQDYGLRVEWLDPNGQPGPGGQCISLPTRQWPVGVPVRAQFVVTPNVTLAPGAWQLRLGLLNTCTDAASLVGETITRPVSVRATSRRFEPSAPVQVAVGANFGDLIELVGITVNDLSKTTRPGATVPVTVTWRAIRPMDTSYAGFVHLMDGSGQVVAQDDHIPSGGQYPTTRWLGGEVVEDRYELGLPAALPPGEYAFEIGLYDAARPGLPRLNTADGRDSVLAGQLIIASP